MSLKRPYLRGIIHCHSNYSHDCLVAVSAYVKMARRHKLDFVILTDHDTTAGSRMLRALMAQKMPAVQVPIAAEYLTDEGDVIAAFMEEEISARRFPAFVDEARSKNALLLLPHPYLGHRAPDKIASQCDLIEIVNCRTRETPNRKAATLAKALGKRIYAGTDAHFARSIANAVVELEDLGSLRASLLSGDIWWATPGVTSRWEYGATQFVKAWKRHDFRLAFRLARSGWPKIVGGMRAQFTLSGRTARRRRWTTN